MTVRIKSKRAHRFRASAQQFSEKTSIHGFLELGENLGGVKKLVWALIMLAVAVVCGALLHELIVDVMSDPKVTSIFEADEYEEPVMVVKPLGATYKLPEMPALDAAELHSLVVKHFLAAKAVSESGIHWGMNVLSVIPSEAETLSAMEHVQGKLQEVVLTRELYGVQAMLQGEAFTMVSSELQAIISYLQGPYSSFRAFAYVDSFLEELEPKLKLVRVSENMRPADIKRFYEDRMPDGFFEAIKLQVYMAPDRVEIRPINNTALLSNTGGMGYMFNLSVKRFKRQDLLGNTRVVSRNDVIFDCDALPNTGQINWQIGSEYLLPGAMMIHENDIPCGQDALVVIKVKKKTYHERYCNKDAKDTCMTYCQVEKARESSTCLPYIGSPEIRPDVPFCSFDAVHHIGDITKECEDECFRNRAWRLCKLVTSQFLERPPLQYNGLVEYANKRQVTLTVQVDITNGMRHEHLEPKYSTISQILGSVGGIVGIGFGMSIMSVMQLLFHFGAAAFQRPRVEQK